QQTRELLGEPLADRVGGTRRRARDRRYQTIDRRDLAENDGAQPRAFEPAGAHRTIERLPEAGQHRFGTGLVLLLALLVLDYLEHALDAEEGLGLWRPRSGAASEALERLQDLGERGLIEPDLRDAVGALDVEVDGQATAADAFAHGLADA